MKLFTLALAMLTMIPSCADTATPARAYFYAAEYADLYGGTPSRVSVTYVGGDGVVQTSAERGGIIESLSTVELDTTGFFDVLRERVGALERSFRRRSDIRDEELPEYYPPYTRVEFGGGDVPEYIWGGLGEDVPDALTALIDAARKLASAKGEMEQPASGFYLRASILDKRTVREFARAGLFVDAEEENIQGCPAVQQALGNPFRLVWVGETDRSLGLCKDRLEPGRLTMEILLGRGAGCQVRCLKPVEESAPESPMSPQ